MSFFTIFSILIILITLYKAIRIVPQGDYWIIERVGKYHTTLGAGLNCLIPYVDSVAYRLSNKDQMLNIPSQEVITKDNAVVKEIGRAHV